MGMGGMGMMGGPGHHMMNGGGGGGGSPYYDHYQRGGPGGMDPRQGPMGDPRGMNDRGGTTNYVGHISSFTCSTFRNSIIPM